MPGLKAVAFTKQVSEGKRIQRVGKEQAAGPGPLPITSDIYRIISRSNLRAHNNSWGLDLCPLSPTSMIERSTNLRKTIYYCRQLSHTRTTHILITIIVNLISSFIARRRAKGLATFVATLADPAIGATLAVILALGGSAITTTSINVLIYYCDYYYRLVL